MPDSNNTEITNRTERMIQDMHAVLLGSMKDGKLTKGLATIVGEHEEILHGGRDGEAGLVGDVKELKVSKLKFMAWVSGAFGTGTGLGHVISKWMGGGNPPGGH